MKRVLILLGTLALPTAGTIAQAQSLPPLQRGVVPVSDVMRGDAGPIDPGPPDYSLVEERGALPPRAIAALLNDEGFSIMGPPIRRGPAYVIAVMSPSGDDGRVTVDAFNGRIIRFRPVMGPNAMILPDDIRGVYARRDFAPPRAIPYAPPHPAPRVAARPAPAQTQAALRPAPQTAPAARPSARLSGQTPAIQTAASTQTAPPAAVATPAKPPVAVQPTQAMPPAMGFD